MKSMISEDELTENAKNRISKKTMIADLKNNDFLKKKNFRKSTAEKGRNYNNNYNEYDPENSNNPSKLIKSLLKTDQSCNSVQKRKGKQKTMIYNNGSRMNEEMEENFQQQNKIRTLSNDYNSKKSKENKSENHNNLNNDLENNELIDENRFSETEKKLIQTRSGENRKLTRFNQKILYDKEKDGLDIDDNKNNNNNLEEQQSLRDNKFVSSPSKSILKKKTTAEAKSLEEKRSSQIMKEDLERMQLQVRLFLIVLNGIFKLLAKIFSFRIIRRLPFR